MEVLRTGGGMALLCVADDLQDAFRQGCDVFLGHVVEALEGSREARCVGPMHSAEGGEGRGE